MHFLPLNNIFVENGIPHNTNWIRKNVFNRRKSNSRGLLFQRVMEKVVSHEPITYESVIRLPEI